VGAEERVHGVAVPLLSPYRALLLAAAANRRRLSEKFSAVAFFFWFLGPVWFFERERERASEQRGLVRVSIRCAFRREGKLGL
jgi:hypothetical protein